MSSSTWRVLSGYATYQRTPIRMTSFGKWAPLKLIAIVSLPHASPLVIEGEHTAKSPQMKICDRTLMPPGAPRPMKMGWLYTLPEEHDRMYPKGLVVRSCSDWCPEP